MRICLLMTWVMCSSVFAVCYFEPSLVGREGRLEMIKVDSHVSLFVTIEKSKSPAAS